MSCEQNANRVSRCAGSGAGVAALAAKFSSAFGAASQRVLNEIDRGGTTARLARDRRLRLAVGGAALGAAVKHFGNQADRRAWAWAPVLGWPISPVFGAGRGKLARAALLAYSAHQTGRWAGNLVGQASRDQPLGAVQAEEVTVFPGLKWQGPPRPVKVPVWTSSLSGALNRLDHLGRRRDVRASDGVVFELHGQTWHRGTTVVDTPGGQRTLTHLQSLTLPPSHYYFERALSNRQAVLIAGRGLEPHQVDGYLGQVSALESLVPVWSKLKHRMIKASWLHSARPDGPPQK